MYTDKQDKPEGTYHKCISENCRKYWEFAFDCCQACGGELVKVDIRKEGLVTKEEKAA